MAGMICAGWDERNGGTVFSIPLGGGIFREAYTVGGSGSGYIYGYCDANFRKGMSKKEAQDFVKNAVSLAMWRDGSSGGIIRLVTISKDGVEVIISYPSHLSKGFEIHLFLNRGRWSLGTSCRTWLLDGVHDQMYSQPQICQICELSEPFSAHSGVAFSTMLL
jgi:hypothetical protein